MLARLSVRFVLVLVVSAAATAALIIMFEAMIRAQLSFGMAAAVVVPLLAAARSCGGAWVVRNQASAGIGPVLAYGAWFALLALIIFILSGFALRLWLGLNPVETAVMLANRPVTTLTVAALAYATCTLISCTGFALGVRAEMRLLRRA